jgi:hypothetical protein
VIAGYDHFLVLASRAQWDEADVDLRADAAAWPATSLRAPGATPAERRASLRGLFDPAFLELFERRLQRILRDERWHVGFGCSAGAWRRCRARGRQPPRSEHDERLGASSLV